MQRSGTTIAATGFRWTDLLRPDDLIVWGQANAEPTTLTHCLMEQKDALPAVRAFVGIGYAGSACPDHADRIAVQSYCGTGTNRALGDALSILPVAYDQLAPLLGAQEPVLLLSLAPGVDADHFGFGAGADYPTDIIGSARLVIAEVNRQAPRTGAGREIRRNQIDLIVETDTPLPLAPATRIGAVDSAIAQRVAELIPDGATLQIGLGSIPAAVLRRLHDHRDLGIHSGLICDEVAMLAEAGVVTNTRKTVDRGHTVCGVLAGGEALLTWANDNHALRLRPTSYTHDSAVLRSIENLVALNSAIEIDLSGQVNAELADGRYVGAVGGAGAFLRGAQAARGGLPIVALPSTVGERSRIVARLSGPVSTSRSDVGIVVTEFGSVDLRGTDLRRRRELLLSICDPAHRTAIEAAL